MKAYIRELLDRADRNLADIRKDPVRWHNLHPPRPPKIRKPRSDRRPVVDGRMKCYSCKEMVLITKFYVHRSKAGYAHHDSYCDPCRKLHMILRYVGLTREEYLAKVAASNGLCEVCQLPYAKPSIDHCHTTGIIRGVLCQSCNAAIGLFQNSPANMRAAADYLDRYHSVTR